LTISIDSTARIWYLNHDDKTATEIGKKNIGNSWGWVRLGDIPLVDVLTFPNLVLFVGAQTHGAQ
jgi:hypothetical protein